MKYLVYVFLGNLAFGRIDYSSYYVSLSFLFARQLSGRAPRSGDRFWLSFVAIGVQMVSNIMSTSE